MQFRRPSRALQSMVLLSLSGELECLSPFQMAPADRMPDPHTLLFGIN